MIARFAAQLTVAFSAMVSLSLASPSTALHVERTRLPNGLDVVLHEDHRTPIVTVNLFYHVGSKDEATGRRGFAHLFEHLMFQGSKHVPEDAYFLYLERVGGTDINGTTSVDRSSYFETVPANRLDLALWLESDRMGFFLEHVDQLSFAGQRDVAKNERRQVYDEAPYGRVTEIVRGALFPAAHPYARPALGSTEDLGRATLDDVREFFRTYYVPNNATLVLAGDFQRARALASIERYFGPIARRPAPRRPTVPAAEVVGEHRVRIRSGAELARVHIAWITPASFAPGDAELDVVASALAGGKSSVLAERLVHDAQLAGSVVARQVSMKHASVFEIVATAQPGHSAEELLAAIDEELARLADRGPLPAQLETARTSVVSTNLFALERVSARAARINYYTEMIDEPAALDRDLARYRAVTAESFRAAVRGYLRGDRRVVGLVVPERGAPIAGERVVGAVP